jgi:hypothetical protein
MTVEPEQLPALLALDAAIRTFGNHVQSIAIRDADLERPDPYITASVRLRPLTRAINIKIVPTRLDG